MNTSLLVAAIMLGGLVKGLNGFGYALVSTSILTLFMPAQEAVTLMIVPLIVSNIELAFKLSVEEIKVCLNRFKLYITAAFIGVIAGMLLIDYMPSILLKETVGLLVIIFVASRTRKLSWIFSELNRFCAGNRRTEPFLGLVSGIVFGSSNVGVPFVAYFKELELSREQFISMIAVTVLASSLLRVGLASGLGLYTGTETILFSAALGIPGLFAVKLGDKIGEHLPQKATEKVSLLLLLVIGLKLLGTF